MDKDVISVVNTVHAWIDKCEDYPIDVEWDELKLKLPIGDALIPQSDDAATLEQHLGKVEEVGEEFNWSAAFSSISSVQDMAQFLKNPRNARMRSWKYWSTVAAFSTRLGNGRFCVTARGYIGFVPYEAKVGDEICIIYGGVVPFVLRQSKGSSRLIGESYIHGIMYGEALLFDDNAKGNFCA